MRDEDQQRLAFDLANCHLEQSGVMPFPCKRSVPTSQCTSRMSDQPIAFNAYTQYFLHVDDICFYLQQQVFQDSTERTVSELYNASTSTLHTLAELYTSHHQLSDNVRTSIDEFTSMHGALTAIESDIAAIDTQQREAFDNTLYTITKLAGQTTQLQSGVVELFQHHIRLEEMNQHMQGGINRTVEGIDGVAEAQNVILARFQPIHDILTNLTTMGRIAADEHRLQKEDHEALNRDIAESRDVLAAHLSSLAKSLSSAVDSLEDGQNRIQRSQSEVLGDLTALSDKQQAEFARAHDSLADLARLSAEAQRHIEAQRAVLLEFQEGAMGRLEAILGFTRKIFGQVAAVTAVLTYLGAIAVIYLLTSCRRLRDVRGLLIVGVVGIAVIDRLVDLRGFHILLLAQPELYTNDLVRVIGFGLLICYGISRFIHYSDPNQMIKLQLDVLARKQTELLSALNRTRGYSTPTPGHTPKTLDPLPTPTPTLPGTLPAMSPLQSPLLTPPGLVTPGSTRVTTPASHHPLRQVVNAEGDDDRDDGSPSPPQSRPRPVAFTEKPKRNRTPPMVDNAKRAALEEEMAGLVPGRRGSASRVAPGVGRMAGAIGGRIAALSRALSAESDDE